ncbi:tetratricopeptide repeat protein [Candidatus Chloroploca asiatica]|nr:tetratricopeptide repeat protein [Candidatus Chloroploca asiatica]
MEQKRMVDVAPIESSTLTPFERHVKYALRHLNDPQRLSQESPLASAYVLSRAIRDLPEPATLRSYGEALRTVIRTTAIRRLWQAPLPTTRDAMLAAIAEVRREPTDPRYAYVVLELRCFHDFIKPNRMSDIWEDPDLLLGSKSQHYREFDAAVKQLATLLLDTLQPSLRRERPRSPETLYGYDQKLATLQKAMQVRQTIVLSGPGGVGKTSLVARACEQLAQRPIFWYTLRPAFNDGVRSLLFALGSFLHEQGSSGLWHYLASVGGEPGDLDLAAGLLREDLAHLDAQAPLLCFDDLEHLAVTNLALMPPAYTQLIDLMEGLRTSATLVLISQRPFIPGDLHLEIDGLTVEDVGDLCHAAGYTLATGEAEQLHSYTRGNPQLLKLMLTLHNDGDQEALIAAPASSARSILPALQRLWRRLTADERRVLQQLAVYPYPAPADVFQATVLEHLERLHLITTDDEGGVMLMPALAPLIRDELSPELRARLHAEAAQVRLERGGYTAAAYHFAQSGDDNRAVQVWFPQRQLALGRGEADLARPIFYGINQQRLGKLERKALLIIRAELRQLAGQHTEGLQELEASDWAEESESGARLWRLRGELQLALGYPDQAIESYGEGLTVITRLVGQQVLLHHRRGIVMHRRRDLNACWQEIHRAEFELEILRGLVSEETGGYEEALAAYLRAQDLAELVSDETLLAQVARQIAAVHGRRAKLEAAVAHGMRAIELFERIGDRVSREKMCANLAAIYVQTREFQAAITIGVPAYEFFMSVHDPYYAAVTAANLAEASYGLGDLASATTYAEAVLTLGDRFAEPYALFTLGEVALSKGETAEAVARFSASMQRAERNDDPYMVAYAQRSLGEALLEHGDLSTARPHIEQSLATFRQLQIGDEITLSEQLLARVANTHC